MYAIRSYYELVGDLDRTHLRHPTDVIAAQVEQLHMLGTLLLIGEQVDFERQVLGLGGAARAGAGDGPQGDRVVLEAHQDLSYNFV